ncbi:hypothetical protein ACE0DR_19725 [Azotobacter sp. CWF10]
MPGATAELAAGIYQRYWLTNLADRLEKSFGPTLLAREELLAWLAEQIERIGASGITDCGLASDLIDEAYQARLKIGSARFSSAIFGDGNLALSQQRFASPAQRTREPLISAADSAVPPRGEERLAPMQRNVINPATQ